MSMLPDPWWVPVILAAVLLADAVVSLHPPGFIRDCLDGVRFPPEWWWALIVIKILAASGLVAGIWLPGVALAANAGVIAYFVCAASAHLRARFTGPSFWINCLGMLAFAVGTFVIAFAV